MRTHIDLTESIRSICQGIVHEHIAADKPFFDVVWHVVCREFPNGRIEELGHALEVRAEARGAVLAALGDGSGQALDSLYVIGAVVNAVLILSKQGKNALLETAHVDTALRNEAARMNAPAHVRRILELHGTALLAEHFSAVDWQSVPTKDSSAVPSRLWIEWCDSSEEESASPQFGAFARDEMLERFDFKKEQFELFLDETSFRILVRPDGGCPGMNLWTKLAARQLRFLYLVLRACRHSRVLPYHEVKKLALRDELASDNTVSRTKSELNKKLGDILDRMVISRPGMNRYEIELIAYCWIRYENAESALLGS